MNPKDIFLHKEPFLFVDEIVEMQYMEYSKGKRTVRNNEFWTEAHFPNNPVFPGVLLLETMAQIGGLLLKSNDDKKLTAYLSKVDKFKVTKKVIPGDEIIVEGFFLEAVSYFVKIKTKAFVRDKKVGEAEITYVLKADLEG